MDKNAVKPEQPKKAAKVAPVVGEYKGKPTISLMREANDRFPFTFGVPKAKLIVEHFDEIVAFVASNP